MRRRFLRSMGVTPQAYRERFSAGGDGEDVHESRLTTVTQD
jgi:hypothetical protein